jgi:hypothetical protein
MNENVAVGQVWGSKTRDDLLLEVLEVFDDDSLHETYDESIRLKVIACNNPDLMGHKTWFTHNGLYGYYKLVEDVLDNPTWEV